MSHLIGSSSFKLWNFVNGGRESKNSLLVDAKESTILATTRRRKCTCCLS